MLTLDKINYRKTHRSPFFRPSQTATFRTASQTLSETWVYQFLLFYCWKKITFYLVFGKTLFCMWGDVYRPLRSPNIPRLTRISTEIKDIDYYDN